MERGGASNHNSKQMMRSWLCVVGVVVVGGGRCVARREGGVKNMISFYTC